MRTHLEFRSLDFRPYPEEEEINSGRFGRRLAELLAEQLPNRGFFVRGIVAEDWGVKIELENADFPLWVGCGNYEEYENGFLCFIEPSTPYVRKWFKKLPTSAVVEKLASSIENILSVSNRVSGLRWWAESEIRP